MALQVKITNGSYRNAAVDGVFPLVRPWKDGANGGFVTIRVDNPSTDTAPCSALNAKHMNALY